MTGRFTNQSRRHFGINFCYAFVLGSFLLAPGPAFADQSLALATEVFVSESFDGHKPQIKALWLTSELRNRLSDILGHPPTTLRIKYQMADGRSLWIFNEIGKVKAITIGVAIAAGMIEDIKVLKFRESRGWEIKYSFFTDQFENTRLTKAYQLDQHIDGITGATLSVDAMKRVARAALLLDQTIQAQTAQISVPGKSTSSGSSR